MEKERLLAFSDGVIAIIITIMVLELKVPHGSDLAALTKILPVFASYALSFIYVAIYWNNHHHLMAVVGRVNGAVLWANMHLLFWLSLIPFATTWWGENFQQPIPTALYGVSLIMPALAYTILIRVLIQADSANRLIKEAIGNDVKGWVSPLIYLAGIFTSLVSPLMAVALYAFVAALWLVPDRRMEKVARR